MGASYAGVSETVTSLMTRVKRRHYFLVQDRSLRIYGPGPQPWGPRAYRPIRYRTATL